MMVKNMRIMIMAVKIRMSRGEDLEAILSRYMNLSEKEKEEIREAVRNV